MLVCAAGGRPDVFRPFCREPMTNGLTASRAPTTPRCLTQLYDCQHTLDRPGGLLVKVTVWSECAPSSLQFLQQRRLHQTGALETNN